MHDKRKWARPITSWTENTIREIQDKVKENNIECRYRPFDEDTKEMVEMMRKISFDGIVEATANGHFNVLDDLGGSCEDGQVMFAQN